MALIDTQKQFDSIKKSAIEAVKTIFPIERKVNKIILKDVWVEDDTKEYSFADQAKIKAREGSFGAYVYAALQLIDLKTNRIVDQEDRVRLFLLPKMTERSSYIVKGNEYQVSNQLRLRPGAYVKRSKAGDFKTQFNLSKGGSAELHISDTGQFNFKISQAKIPLYPVLIGLGFSEGDLRKAWGDKVFMANKETNVTPQNAIRRIATSFANSKSDNFETAKEDLKTYLKEKTSISPEMTKLTLGKEFSNFSPMLWLEASKKLIAVERGEATEDDVDNLAFKEFFGIDDAIKERIEKNKAMLISKINRNLDAKEKIKSIINVGAFGNLVESFFTEDDRSATPEQVNPLHMYAGHEKVTFLGPGSITDEKQVSDEMRNVHPTHLSFLDPIATPESSRIGLNLSLALGSKKSGKELVSSFYNVKTRKFEDLRPVDVYTYKVAFPDQWDISKKEFKSSTVRSQYKGKITDFPASQIDFVMPFAQNAFSLPTNMIPFMANDNGNRTMMAGKHMEYAIPLKDREEPLVQNKVPGKNITFEELVGNSDAIFATHNGQKNGKPVKGTIVRVSKEFIELKSGREIIKIPIYNNFTLNQKTFLNHDVKVKAGDQVEPGQLLADTNYTKNGVLSLGKPLRTAYLAYKGYNFEDGIVITESAAKKMTSEHIYKVQIGLTKNTVLNLGKFISYYPNDITQDNRAKLTEEGIIKKGSKVRNGDVLIAALKDQQGIDGIEQVKARLHKSLTSSFKNIAETWDKNVEGVVTDVYKTSGYLTVHVKTEEPMTIGDKMAGRHGNKGIVTKIIPDSHAPKDAEGNPVEVILNPHGVISRINVGQIYESAVSKAALKNGKIYKVENFTGENYLDTVNNEMKKAGIEDTEELFDPLTGKSLGKIHVGNPYLLKLNKQSEVNFSIRGESGPVAKTTMQPTRGGEDGSKALDMLTMYSLLSHGSRANLKEMSTIKSENNPEFWEALKYGRHLPAPQSPFVFNKFVNMLKASGVDVRKNGSQFQLLPLTDEQTKKMSKIEVQDGSFFHAKKDKLIEEKGGLLDLQGFGGAGGDRWGHIELKEHAVNPVFEEAVKSVLGISQTEYDQIINGTKKIKVKDKELVGGEAIRALLSQINVKSELSELKLKLEKLKGNALDKAVKKYRLLTALDENKIAPADAYTRKLIPVIPPKFRPVSVMETGDVSADDTNWLYRDVTLINKQMKKPVVDLLDDSDLVEIRDDLNERMKGLSGLTDIKMSGREKFGFIAQIKGKNQPKEGFFQSKVLKKNQTMVGRGTIIPEPKLHIDEMGMPEAMAWKLFSPFVIKELIKTGLTATRAKEELTNKTPLAKKILDKVMSQRPVLLNRAPSLHKFSIMAFQPTITEGTAIKIPPLVTQGFNADFNGDSIASNSLIPVRYKDETSGLVYILCDTILNIFKQITGKTEEEMVKDAKGFTAIYEIPLDKVQTIGIVDGTLKWVNIQRLTVHTSHGPCYKIKTNTGTQGVFSEHHNFSFIDDDLNLKCIKTEDMPINVLIPKSNLVFAWGKNEYQSTKIGNKSIIVDEMFAYVLGFYAGEGHLSDRRHSGRGMELGFTDTEGTLLDVVEKFFNNLGYPPNLRQGTSEHPKCITKYYNNELALWFLEHSGKDFSGKKIPSIIFNSPIEVRKQYIYGVLEAEGNICQDGFDNSLIRIEMENNIFLRQLRILMSSCGIYTYFSETFNKDRSHKAWKILFSKSSWDKLTGMPKAPKADLVKLAYEDRNKKMKVSREVYDIVPITEKVLEEINTLGKTYQRLNKEKKGTQALWRKNHPGRKIFVSDHFKNKKDVQRKYTSRTIAKDLIHTYGAFADKGGSFYKWMNIVTDESLQWEIVESIEETTREEVLFDFTVPEGETFCIDNGLITHNTMTVHTPITDKAVREAYKMMPSRNLFQPGSKSLMIAPAQESQLGFYLLSRTTEGRKKINDILPSHLDIQGEMDKKASKELFMKLAKELDPDKFAKVIDLIKVAGENEAYESGFTISLKDMEVIPGRDKIISDLKKATKNIENDPKKLKDFSESFDEKFKKVTEDAIEANFKGRNNSLYEMVKSGARGNMSQLRQIVASPLIVNDPRGNMITKPIEKSFSEGLSLSDYWTASFGARKGMMDRALSTKDPGVFNKALIAVTMDNVVSMEDCDTKDGVNMSIEDRNILGRYLQGDHKGIGDETVIDEKILQILIKKGFKEVFVRSPIKCKAPKGTCRHCYGVDESGKVVNMGDNLGVKAAQAISEPLTQIILNSFHTGGVAGTGNKSGYQRIEELMHMPKNIRIGKATLAVVGGEVTKIESSGLGGHFVFIGDHKHIINRGLELKVKKGQRVKKGDALSEGSISPQELLELKSMEEVQDYMVSELDRAYQSQGQNIEKKTFETVVKSMTDKTEVLNDVGNLSHLPGQTISYREAIEYNKNRGDKPELKHKPFLAGIKYLPQSSEDWMAQMGATRLAEAIVKGASQGWMSDTKGYHPIPAFAYGATFGEGDNGKY